MFDFLTSPKTMLAHALASTLDTFFIVDPATIETNLIRDAKIVLHDLELKPQQHVNSTLKGRVKEVEFSWIWGGNAQTSLVRETRLVIRGAQFRLLLSKKKNGENDEKKNSVSLPPPQQQSQTRVKDQNMTYIQRHVQQIVNHLTLVISDMELSIECESDGTEKQKVVMQATNLDLISFGKTDDDVLSQRISLDSFGANVVVENDDNATSPTQTILPLIEPIGYAASVERVAGRRFVDGLKRGLKITGEEATIENGVVLHAGTVQMQVIHQMMELLLPNSSEASTETMNDKEKALEHIVTACNAGDDTEEDADVALQDDEVFEDALEMLGDTTSDDEDVAAATTASPSTTFELPLPTVALVLSNGAKISMPTCTLHYSADGSVCNLQGTHGILVNQDVHMFQLRDEAKWCFDFINNGILFSGGQEVVADVVWHEKEMKKVMSGIRQLVRSTPASVLERVEDTLQETKPAEAKQPPPWSIAIEGSIRLCMQGDNDLDKEDEACWIEATIDSPSVVLSAESAGSPSEFNIAGITLGPTSFGKASVRVPAISLEPDEQVYVVHGPVEAHLESTSLAQKLQAFLTRVLHLDDFSTSTSVPSKDMTRQVPFDIHVPKVTLTVDEPQMQIVADGVKLSDKAIHVDDVKWKEGSGMSASVLGADAMLEPHLTAKLHQVSTMVVPDAFVIVKPVRDTTLCFVDSVLHVEMDSAHVATVLPNKVKRAEESTVDGGFILRFPIEFGLNELKVFPSTERGDFIQLTSINVTVFPHENAIGIDSRDTVGVRMTTGTEWLDSSVAPTKVVLRPSSLKDGPSSVKCAGIRIGPSSCGDISLIIPSVSLDSETGALEIDGILEGSLHSSTVLDRLQALTAHLFGLGNAAPTSSGTDSFIFRYHVSIPEARLQLAEPAVEVGLKKLLLRDSALHCHSIKCTEASGISGSMSEVSANLTSPMEVAVRRIEWLHIPGKATLADPVSGASFKYADGILQVNLPSVDLITPLLGNGAANEAPKGINGQDDAVILPCPVNARIRELRLWSSIDLNCSIRVQPLDVVVVSHGEALSVDASGPMAVHIASSSEESLTIAVGSSSAVMSPSKSENLISSFDCSSIQVEPSPSFQISADVPSVILTAESDEIKVGGVCKASVQSVEDIKRLQTLFARFFPEETSTMTSAADSVLCPYHVSIPEASIRLTEPAVEVELEQLHLRDSSLRCHFFKCTEASGIIGSMSEVSANFTSPMEAAVRRIESLHIPGKATLADPVSGASFKYADGILQVNLPSVDLITPLLGNGAANEAPKGINGQDDAVILPCPVNARIQELRLWSSIDLNCSIRVQPLDVVVVSQNEALSVDASGPMTVHIASSSEESLTIAVGSSSAVMSPSRSENLISSFDCSSIQVEPSPSFQISADVPSVILTAESDEIKVGGVCKASVQSAEDIKRLQTLFARFFPQETSVDPPPLPMFTVPEFKLSVVDVGAQLVAENIKVDKNDVSCERMLANDDKGTSAALSGVRTTIRPDLTIGIEWLESLYIPGVCSLEAPVQCITLAFVGECLCTNVGSIKVMSLSNVNETGAKQQLKVDTPENDWEVPFPIRFSLKELVLNFPISCVGETTYLGQIELDIKATPVDPFSTVKTPQGAVLYIAVDQVENKMMKIDNMRAAGTIFGGKTDTIHRFAFAAKTAVVVAGFSSVDWSNMFGGEEEKVPLLLPYASIEPFKAHLALEGNVLATRLTADVPLFQGDAKTTSDDLIQHVTSAVLSKAPSIITNSEFLGENVLEMSTKSGGRMLMASTLAGSAAGSVTGLIAADSIRGAITSGKKSRNASTDDRYHFGDVSRGTARSISQAAKFGAEVRRGSCESYHPGDFTVGASRATCNYASENKSRLLAASGSGVGMAVGTALLGPVGFVAGGYIGSKLGGSVFEDDAKKSSTSDSGKSERVASEQRLQQYHGTKQKPCAPAAPLVRDEDLLGLSAPPLAVKTQSASASSTAASSFGEVTYSAPLEQQTMTSSPVAAGGGEADLLGLGYTYDFAAANIVPPPKQPPVTMPHPLQPSISSTPQVSSVPRTQVASIPRAAVTAPTVEPRGHQQQMASHRQSAGRGRVPPSHPAAPQQTGQDEKYHFGDLTRSVVNRGKRRDGRSGTEGYKFGDFTRGLFG